MKEKLKLALANSDLPNFEKEYLLEVVEYIDNHMSVLENQDINFGHVISTMLELVQSINNCKTGVSVIDNVVNLRKQNAYEQVSHLGDSAQDFVESKDYRTSTYDNIQNYIAIISNYGGLYKFVSESYEPEIKKIDTNEKKSNKS